MDQWINLENGSIWMDQNGSIWSNAQFIFKISRDNRLIIDFQNKSRQNNRAVLKLSYSPLLLHSIFRLTLVGGVEYATAAMDFFQQTMFNCSMEALDVSNSTHQLISDV